MLQSHLCPGGATEVTVSDREVGTVNKNSKEKSNEMYEVRKITGKE